MTKKTEQEKFYKNANDFMTGLGIGSVIFVLCISGFLIWQRCT